MELFNRSLLNESLEHTLSRIPRRLKNSVTQIDILNWLDNFKAEEYDMALSVLEAVEYVSESELVEFLQVRLTTLFTDLPKDRKVYIIPIADYGKSSTLLVYYLKKTPFYRAYSSMMDIIPDYNKLKNKLKTSKIENPTVVLFDDFMGSGKSLYSYTNTFVIPQFAKYNIEPEYIVLCIYYLEKSKRYLEDKIGQDIKIIGEIRNASFERGASPFTGNQRLLIRDFAHHYGKDIFATENPYKTHPLGFENSQALVVFPYNPPNNTIPILWASRFSVAENRYWKPLFPRVPEAKIESAKKLRSDFAFEMALLRTTQLESLFYTGKVNASFASRSFIQNTDFKTFAYIRLKMQRRSESVICQLLGVTMDDLDMIKNEAIKRGVFNTDLDFTDFGRKSYDSIMDILTSFKKKVAEFSKPIPEDKEILYLPKVFRGQKKELN